MIAYKGYDDVIARVREAKQDHVFDFWDGLSDDEKKRLLDDLAGVDFALLERLYSSAGATAHRDYSPAPFIRVPETADERKRFDEARNAGIEAVRAGKTAAFMVAGGQGSRLGYDGPKGKFPIGPVSGKTLFQIHAEKVLASSRKYGVSIPLLVMTSTENNDETVEFFDAHKNFGLPEEDVIIFAQNMIPSLDTNGKLILQSKCGIFKNPDGHGGSLTAMQTSGAMKSLRARGVEIISYFQVDNPLVRVIDPVFIGFHTLEGADVSSKALLKAYPEEKVGVFVRFDDGSVGVVEYSDLPEHKVRQMDEKGGLAYSAGSVAIHLFSRAYIESLTSGTGASLPFHTAKKKIRACRGETFQEIDGYKFEKFVFDALPLTERNVILESRREEEFAPVKNPAGIDSVESSRALISGLARSWCAARGVAVPACVKALEISPLRALEAEDINPSMKVPELERVYIDARSAG